MGDEIKLLGRAQVREIIARAEGELFQEQGRASDEGFMTVCEVLADALPALRGIDAYLENLATSQRRGTELQDEARALRRTLANELPLGDPRPGREHGEQFRILVDLLKVRWRGDARYGGAAEHADLPLDFENADLEFLDWFDPAQLLSVLRGRKSARKTGHVSWRHIVLEEVCELLTAEGEEHVVAEAIDVANVCLKMVEAIRVRRARVLQHTEQKRSAVSVVRDGDKILAVWNKRLSTWGLPGGKVEPGETPEEAQRRELLEETGLSTLTATLLFSERYSGDGGRLVHVYEVVPDHLGPRDSIMEEDGCPHAWFTWEQLVASSTLFGAFYARHLKPMTVWPDR